MPGRGAKGAVALDLDLDVDLVCCRHGHVWRLSVCCHRHWQQGSILTSPIAPPPAAQVWKGLIDTHSQTNC